MKIGRNEPCPCGSGKKYKHCCLNKASQQNTEILDVFNQIIAMNPHLTLDELNALAQHKIAQINDKARPDFCGLSPSQMHNWLHAPFSELTSVTINTPDDLSSSPVMRYLTLILDEAMQNEGSFKATSKGNLPAKLVKKASALLPEFAVAPYETEVSTSEFAGSNEDKFNALHYTRILAEIAGIIYRRSGSYHVKKSAQKEYQRKGIHAFFKPMLEAAIYDYNWSYFDSWEDNTATLRVFWLFMLWRLQTHSNVDQLIDEMETAFPNLLHELAEEYYWTPKQLLHIQIESRFVNRFLQFWGFVVMPTKYGLALEQEAQTVQIQPLFTATFQFMIKG